MRGSAASSGSTTPRAKCRSTTDRKPFPEPERDSISPTHARRLDRQPRRAPCEVELEIGQLGCARTRHLRANPIEARADAPLERAEALPFEPISGKRGAVS